VEAAHEVVVNRFPGDRMPGPERRFTSLLADRRTSRSVDTLGEQLGATLRETSAYTHLDGRLPQRSPSFVEERFETIILIFRPRERTRHGSSASRRRSRHRDRPYADKPLVAVQGKFEA
jgi:hypothetical protein